MTLLLEKMSISVNGESKVPPGFRFHPTEEELLLYYLKKKVSFQQIDLDVIQDVDLNKLEPWDIQEKCIIGSTPQNDWYFFSHKDKKYPTGTRTNRATISGFWKATGRDKVIYSNSNKIGMRKTLVFYKGRAPHGLKSDWIMHEYRLHDNERQTNSSHTSYMVPTDAVGEGTQLEESWVVCRVFRKKNLYKSLEEDNIVITTAGISTDPEETRITELMLNEERFETTNHKEENSGMIQIPIPIDNINSNKLMQQLPTWECPNYSYRSSSSVHLLQTETEMMNNQLEVPMGMASLVYSNLGELDRLVASHSHMIQGEENEAMHAQPMAILQQPNFNDSNNLLIGGSYPTPTHHDVQMQEQLRSSTSTERVPYHCHQDYTSTQFDLWSIDPSL